MNNKKRNLNREKIEVKFLENKKFWLEGEIIFKEEFEGQILALKTHAEINNSLSNSNSKIHTPRQTESSFLSKI